MTTPDHQIHQLPISALRESPTNPRRSFAEADLADLAESIRQQGILQPLLVRPLPGAQLDMDLRFELVFGHRRLRAARLAGLEWVPCQLRDMDDRAVALAQVAENLQRADVSPLEEADGFVRLRRDHGMSADDIAAAVSKSRSYVFGRLKLAEAAPMVRVAIVEQQLPADIGLELARLSPAAQVVQLKQLRNQRSAPTVQDHGWPSVRVARQQIRHSMRLRIGTAPWTEDDTRFGPACVTCPKLARNDPDLAEAFDADVCTDSTCYGVKHTAWADEREVEITARGVTVVSGDAAAKLIVARHAGYMTLTGGLQRLADWLDRAAADDESTEAVPILDALDQIRAAGYSIPTPTVIRVGDPAEFIAAMPATAAHEVTKAWEQMQRGGQPQRPMQQAWPMQGDARAARDDDEYGDADETVSDLFGDKPTPAGSARPDPMAGASADERAALDPAVQHRLRLAVVGAAWAAAERTRGELLMLLRREIDMAGGLPDSVMGLSGLQAKWEAVQAAEADALAAGAAPTVDGERTWLLHQLDDMTGAELARILVCTAVDDELAPAPLYLRNDRGAAARRVDVAMAYGVSPSAAAEQAARPAVESESDDTTEALHG